ncbi:sporulation integral membrane protein YtvI [Oikeobacillus pervagus]|uniref:sporulation integral membrane protein YtvI n=1 Tax=Oikeobacillus pervagus TaxID=1325931 RepID=UPI0027D8B314|nr:sporulation integral membrane protein YtvI [Oikeobacillus pervagus]
MNPDKLYRVLRFFIIVGSIFAVAYGLLFVSKVTYPFIIAFIIALSINPLVDFLERRLKMPRTASVIVSIMIIMGAFIGIITLLITEIVSGANYLGNVLPGHVQTLVQFIQNFITAQIIPIYEQATLIFKNLEMNQQETIIDNIQSVGQSIASTAGSFLQNLFQGLPNLITWIPNAATVLIFSLLATFFISKDWNRLKTRFTPYLPDKARSSGRRIFEDLKKALFGFIKAQLTLISITTVIVLIGLLILRVKYAITIALIAGIVDILPYLGTGTVFVPWIIYEVITGNLSLAIGLLVLYIIIIVQRQIMEPKVLSSSIGLDPLATLIALFVGFKLVGFLGLIIGPVTLVILKTLHEADVFRDIWKYIKGEDSNNSSL